MEAAAVTLFVVIPLLLGIIQFALFYGASNSLTQVTREGARYAAVYGLRNDGAEGDDAYIKDRMLAVARAANLKMTAADITIEPARPARTQYTPINIAVQYNLDQKRIIPVYSPGVLTRRATTMLE